MSKPLSGTFMVQAPAGLPAAAAPAAAVPPPSPPATREREPDARVVRG